MTTVVVRGTGFTAAVEHLRSANQDAATQAQTLARELRSCGAMIGHPTLAGGLARAYDRAAAQALAGHATLTATLSGLGAATAASLYNHTRADVASYVGPTHHLDEPMDPAGADPHGWDEVDPPGPLPTSLGGTDADLPGWAREVLDLVQGFVWPDADLARLRSAARAWHRSGHGLAVVGHDVLAAAAALEVERSPEVPLAQATLRRLHTRLLAMAGDHHQVANVCLQYADLVADRRTLILGLVREVEQQASALLDTFLHPSPGDLLNPVARAFHVGEAALDSAGALYRAATEAAPRFLGYLDELRAGAADLAGTLDDATTSLDGLDRDLFFTDPRSYKPQKRRPDPWLRRHEGGPANGHTIRDHVGKTDGQLHGRLRSERDISFASTFPDEQLAGSVIRQAIAANTPALSAFLQSGERRMSAIHWRSDTTVGRMADRTGKVRDVKGVRLLIVRDESMSGDYRVLTAYPER